MPLFAMRGGYSGLYGWRLTPAKKPCPEKKGKAWKLWSVRRTGTTTLHVLRLLGIISSFIIRRVVYM